jgi:hypothetical protein
MLVKFFLTFSVRSLMYNLSSDIETISYYRIPFSTVISDIAADTQKHNDNELDNMCGVMIL